MEDNQIFPEVPDELYNAGWRVHYNVEDHKQYFVNEQTKMRSDTLPTVVKSPSTNLTLFENANIDLTESFVPSFYSEAKELERNLATTSGQSPSEEKPFEKGAALGKPYQKLMEDSTTRFPLGGKRHVVVKQYRGVPYVNIREYFGGETKDRLIAVCNGHGEIKISDTAREMVTYIFASMMDRVAYGYLEQNCEGCDMGWPSQLDHRCLNFGSNVPVTDMYFNDLQHLVKDEWVIDAVRDYLLKSVEIDSVRAVMQQLRTSWSQSPELSVEAMENSKVNGIIKGHLEDEFIPRWMGAIDYSSVELNYTL
ncbi:hypothetical protein HOLleu_39210 [Holothuria leucospilota]|uniref:Transcriptional coactivator p15 (PC4) C-terminal domain-containing protein n=1 Tax=Holothuria leucospilota TaxID=206669 RepID=A0A9Q0YIB1_HOLLE|nr:hypothetical protein HOLleu_39210 [Holothuria leucospilota]